MTTTPPPPPPSEGPGTTTGTTTGTTVDDGPRVTRDEVRDLTRLRRTTGPYRNVAGVAGGLGRHLDVDPVILRVAFVVLTFFGGAGLILYAAGWLLVPDDTSTRSPLGLDERSRTVALWIAGGIGAIALLGTTLGDGFVPFPLVVVAGVALLVLLLVNRRKEGTPPAAPAPGGVLLDKPAAGWTPPPPPRVNPRKRGPVLFWFTLALCALGLGVLGVVDAAGAAVAGSAYPALVLGVVGAMLLLGAFWGRAGGLVLVGLLTLPWLLGSLAVGSFDGDAYSYRPITAADVRATYTIDNGEIVLDLRDVADPQALAGRTITLDGNVGHLQVLVPAGLAVRAEAAVDGPGGYDLFGTQGGGLGSTGNDSSVPGAAGTDTDPLVIDAHLEVGAIEVQSFGSTR